MQHQQNTAAAEGARSHCGGMGGAVTGYKSRDSGIEKADITQKGGKGQGLKFRTPVHHFKK